MKQCSKCKIIKEFSFFYKNSTRGDGHQHRCKDCQKIYSDQPKAKERNRIRSNIYRLTNFKKTEASRRKSLLKNKFNLTELDYKQLSSSQNNLCAICQQPETATCKGTVKFLAVDHCHKTGRIRGLLCTDCNTSLGKFKDNPQRFINAANYLLKSENQ